MAIDQAALDKIATSLGLDPSEVGALLGGGEDEDEGDIYGIPKALSTKRVAWEPMTPPTPNDIFRAGERGSDPSELFGAPTAAEMIADFYSLDRDSLVELQKNLTAFGWYKGKSDPNEANLADEGFFKAWKSVVTVAARSGRSIQEVLGSGASAAGDGKGDRPLSIRLSNPDDIDSNVKKLAKQIVGRNISDDEVARIREAYQSLESADQTAAYNVLETGGTIEEQTPSLETFAEDQLRTSHGMEAEGVDLRRGFDVFQQAISRDFGGL